MPTAAADQQDLLAEGSPTAGWGAEFQGILLMYVPHKHVAGDARVVLNHDRLHGRFYSMQKPQKGYRQEQSTARWTDCTHVAEQCRLTEQNGCIAGPK